MQAPATVLESLLANIRSRQQFIRAQAQAGNPNLVSVQASQVSSLRGLIASQPFLEVDDATTLTEEVSSGIWSPEERISLITAISDASARRVAPMTRAARKQQSCDNLHLFFIADDWRDFDNEDWSIEKKIHTMGKRMWQFGLTCPKEDVLKRGSVILTLAALKDPTLSAESKRNMAKRLQEVIKHIDSVSRHPFTHVALFQQAQTSCQMRCNCSHTGLSARAQGQSFQGMRNLCAPPSTGRQRTSSNSHVICKQCHINHWCVAAPSTAIAGKRHRKAFCKRM